MTLTLKSYLLEPSHLTFNSGGPQAVHILVSQFLTSSYVSHYKPIKMTQVWKFDEK